MLCDDFFDAGEVWGSQKLRNRIFQWGWGQINHVLFLFSDKFLLLNKTTKKNWRHLFNFIDKIIKSKWAN